MAEREGFRASAIGGELSRHQPISSWWRSAGGRIGVGQLGLAAKLAGHNVTAVEMDERCCQYLRDVVGVAAYKPDETGALPDGLARYDVVALWHVI